MVETILYMLGVTMTGVEIAAVAGTAITVGDVMLVAGAAMSMMQMHQQQQFQKSQAQYNAAVARNNATQQRQAAAAERARAEREQRLRSGSQRARYGASGVTLEGTPLDLMTDTEIEAQLDQMMITYNGEVAANASNSQARGFDYEAKNAGTGFGANVASTLLTTGSKIGTKTLGGTSNPSMNSGAPGFRPGQ
jgi:hypothetical protein